MVTFGGKPIFEDLTLHIKPRERIALVGRNGAGKTTLMNIITGDRELDDGKRWLAPGTTIGYLPQSLTCETNQTIYEFVLSTLKPEEQTDDQKYRADIVLAPLYLNGTQAMNTLSGGQLRRAALAKSLIAEPNILLLDEPTNHLDIASIEWLENYLTTYKGAVLCISHDRTFLKNMSNSIWWLDRGNLRTTSKSYEHFDQWYVDILEHESRELENLSRKVDQENQWLAKGVTARRKRNERRLKEVYQLRSQLKADRAEFNQTMNTIKLDPLPPAKASKLVAECKHIHKSFHNNNQEIPILKDFSIRLLKKDRVGIVGKNGSGKTTFLKIITKQLTPDNGHVRLGKHLKYSYFDQKRETLDPKKTLWETLCPNGGDTVKVGDKHRHVVAYLKDFMFDPKLAKTPTGTLSGGQANRLLLAKLLADPGDVLILDEPTNDLDTDTLDMLQEILMNYNGTLIIVSHDRDFLDRTVTKLLVFEGNAQVEGYIGGYSDYLAHKHPEKLRTNKKQRTKSKPTPKPKKTEKKKLSFKQQYQLDHLPAEIEKLEQEITTLETTLLDPNLYTENKETFDHTTVRLNQAKQELTKAEETWLELESLREEIESS